MVLLWIQIVGSLFGLFMLYYSFLNYKKKEFSSKEFIFWIVLWAMFIIVALFPSILEPFTKSVGFFRPLDFLIVSGSLFLIAITFYTYTLTRKTQKQVESIVRSTAIKKARKK